MKTLLVDIGSTYTKVVLVDSEKILGQAQAPTTVTTDVTIGLRKAIKQLSYELGVDELDVNQRYACSSAGGGLRMIAIGLVPTFTAKAAQMAALGAGARVLKTYSYEISAPEIEQIEQATPDLVLLAGGTDGGDKETIIHNARMLANSRIDVPIIVAGNKSAADEVSECFASARKPFKIVENVMPELGKLNIEPTKIEIRELFLKRIILAKGIDRAKDLVEIKMPTPMAVSNAARLLSMGTQTEKGLGELMIVSVGGATTDVHSIASGSPSGKGVMQKGLQEPYVKRTVEGDLGVRYNATTILDVAGRKNLLANIGTSDLDIEGLTKKLAADTARIPETNVEFAVDTGLAATAVELAVKRHAGIIERRWSPQGEITIQLGKDLTQIKHVIGTGGPIVFSRDPRKILQKALFSKEEPLSLRPLSPRFYVDREYIVFAMGLLAEVEPDIALKIMKRHIVEI